MKSQLTDILFPIAVTLLILVGVTILATSFLPLLGLRYYIIPFNILVVLYLGFKLQTPWLPFLIFLTQYVFSFFSIEGWELGTIAGILISILISYLRDIIHLSSSVLIIFFVQIFQLVWFFIIASLIYFKTGDFAYLLERFWRFIPESIMISLLAPLAFFLLDRFWRLKEGSVLGDEG